MDLGVYAPSPWSVIAATIIAVIVCAVMFIKGHNLMIVPVGLSIGWIGLGYLMGQLGLDHEGSSSIIRSGLVVLCSSIAVGGLVWLWSKRRDN